MYSILLYVKFICYNIQKLMTLFTHLLQHFLCYSFVHCAVPVSDVLVHHQGLPWVSVEGVKNERFKTYMA